MKYIIKTGRQEGKFQLKVFKEVETVEFEHEADAKRARGMLFRTLKDAGHDVERATTEPVAAPTN